MGDGVLIYFGWPQAHETMPTGPCALASPLPPRSVRYPWPASRCRSALASQRGLWLLASRSARVMRAKTAVGETPNLAARLQGLAGPGQVVIDAATHRQIGGLFDSRISGGRAQRLAKVTVPAWRVVDGEPHARPVRGAALRGDAASRARRGN